MSTPDGGPSSQPGERRRGARLTGNLVLLALSLAFSLALLEVGARLLAGGRKGGKEQDERRFYTEYDPWLGWRHKPGARVAIERRDYKSEVRINGLGLCDRERSYEKPRDGYRILLLGDSFVEAFSVPEGGRIAALMEASLAGRRRPVEVINAGVVGYSTDQEYLFFSREAFRFAPDVVLLFVYYNDILANGATLSYRKSKPKLDFTKGFLRVAGVPVPQVAGDAAPPPPSAPRGSVALAMIGDRLERAWPSAHELLARIGLWSRTRVVPVPGELRVYRKHWPKDAAVAFQITGRILKTLAGEVWSRGGRFAAVYIPSSLEVYEGDWDLTRRRYGLAHGEWDRGRVADALAAMAREARYPFLDLTPALKQRSGGFMGRAYYVHDTHWNVLGHEIAAEAVRTFLAENGWLPP